MSVKLMIQLGLPIFGFLAIWVSVKLITFFKSRSTNTELWATVFESMTNYTIPQKPLQQPKVYMEKKTKRDGRDQDT